MLGVKFETEYTAHAIFRQNNIIYIGDLVIGIIIVIVLVFSSPYITNQKVLIKLLRVLSL